MSLTAPPKIVNGELNSVFNTTDFVATTEGKNDAKYLKLTGGTLSGGLTTPSLTVNGASSSSTLSVSNEITTNGITSSGTNRFYTNIGLPSTYNSSPNSAFPTSTQMGGFLTVSAGVSPVITASSGTVTAIASLIFPPGVWMVSWRASIYPSSGSGTYSNIRVAFSTQNGSMAFVTDVQQRVAISSSQTCTQGQANGYDCSLMGSTILQLSGPNTTYYLNGGSVFTSASASQWRGHIHAVRIA